MRRPHRLAVLIFVLGLSGHLDQKEAQAQLGAIEAFARRVTDVSFYLNTGNVFPASDGVKSGDFGLASYGLELLFSIGEVGRPIPNATLSEGDSAEVEWIQTTVTRHDDHTDTTNVCEVRKVPRKRPTEPIWLFEMGLGYGQVQGFKGADGATDLRGTVRDLPSVSFYASFEPVGGYFGLRSRFMQVQGLQYYDEAGVPSPEGPRVSWPRPWWDTPSKSWGSTFSGNRGIHSDISPASPAPEAPLPRLLRGN